MLENLLKSVNEKLSPEALAKASSAAATTAVASVGSVVLLSVVGKLVPAANALLEESEEEPKE